MSRMLSLFLIYLLHTIYGHTDFQNTQNDADLQAAVMPQELNPQFVSEKDSPWREVLPIPRSRRGTDVSIPENTIISHSIKLYSRMASCIALAVAAVIEIVLYILEFYT